MKNRFSFLEIRWENRGKTAWNSLLALAILGHLALNATFSLFLLCVAGSNYPGGLAIARLHRLERDSIEPVHVHIDVLTAQTGVSRFTQTNTSWIYSKQENLIIDDPEMLQFTHLLMEGKSKYSPSIKPYLKTHDIMDSIDAFSHIALNYNMLPPIRIKTRPTIFIMKRKSNIKYDPNKARLQTSTKDFVDHQVDDTKNIELNTSFKEEIVNGHAESMEELEKVKETIEQNFLDIELEETRIENDTMEKKEEIIDDLADDNMTSMENTTWETENVNKVSSNSRDKNEENIDSQKDVSDVSDIKPDKRTKVEENIKRKSKNGVNSRQETQGVKETVKKMIQEKMLEAKQRREVNGEQKSIEPPIKPTKKKGVADLLKKIGVLKQEVKEPPIFIDKSATMEEEPNKLHVKDDELGKQKSVIQKKDKIKVIKSGNLEQSEDIAEEENEIVDVKVDAKKITQSRDKVDAELSASTEAEIAEEEEEEDIEENIKKPKSINVRESIRSIIDQFIEFEENFLHDDTDTMASTNDMSNRNHIESDSYMETDYSAENGQVKDARESLKEIINQFKYIKHELTSEEDDQFDEIAAKYMERPIAETLLQFSEALKSLIQRRKKASSMERAASLHNNKGIYISENQRKSVAKESNVNSNNANTNGKGNSQKNIKSRE